MSNFRDNKVEMFSERDTIDEVIEYASKAAGPEGVTAAMVMYNTLLELLAKQEDESAESET